LEKNNDVKNCKNCKNTLSGNYCDNCGQRASINKVTFKETFQDFIDMVFSVNAPLMLTIKLLVTNPGKLFREYLSGKRKTYYKPVPFFILMTIIYIAIRALINYNPMAGVPVEQNDKIDVNLFMVAGKFMVANINNILFLFVFSCGIILKLFFYKKYSLAEYFAISFYLIGIYNLLGTVMMFYLKYVNPQLKFIPAFLMLIYLIYALISFFNENKLFVVIKAVLVYSIAFTLYVVFGYGFSFLIVWFMSS